MSTDKCQFCDGLGYWRDDCDQRRVKCDICAGTGRSEPLKKVEIKNPTLTILKGEFP